MAGEPDFLNSVTSRYAMARDVFARISTFLNKATFKIKRGPPLETIDEIAKRFKTDDYDRLTAQGTRRDQGWRDFHRREDARHQPRELSSLRLRA